MIAHAIRAILFASATATSILGLHANMRAHHVPSGAPLRLCAAWTADMAPMISNRRRSFWPILCPTVHFRRKCHERVDILPSLVLPPVECWRGARPIQAAKSRPLENISGGAASTAIDTAVTGPIPGMAINRRATSFCRAIARRCRVSSSIRSLNPAIRSKNIWQSWGTSGGKRSAISTTAFANRGRC